MMDLSVTPVSLVSSVYEKLTENIKKLRERKNAPLTLAEKLLFGHATDINSVACPKRSFSARVRGAFFLSLNFLIFSVRFS